VRRQRGGETEEPRARRQSPSSSDASTAPREAMK
jgi:hypothetical protein